MQTGKKNKKLKIISLPHEGVMKAKGGGLKKNNNSLTVAGTRFRKGLSSAGVGDKAQRAACVLEHLRKLSDSFK